MSLCILRLGRVRASLIIPILHACIEGILYYFNDIDYEPRTILYSFEMGGLLGLYVEELVFDWTQEVKEMEKIQKELEEEATNKKTKKKKNEDKYVTIIEENGKKKRKPLFILRRYPKPPKPISPDDEKKKKKEEKAKEKEERRKKKRKSEDLK